MIFVKALTIPAGTAIIDAIESAIACTPGKVIEVEITFPAGCVGLVGVKVKDWEHVIWPSNPESWFIADGYTITWNEDYNLLGSPHILKVVGYNLDDTFPHTIYLF